MRAARRRSVTLFVTVVALVLSGFLVPGVASADPGIRVFLEGLSSPKGLAKRPSNGNPVVAQGAFGPPGPVIEYVVHGRNAGTVIEHSEPVGLVDIALGEDGSAFAIGTDLVLYYEETPGVVVPLLDIPAYQATDPDPVDQEGDDTESNPYGLAVLPSGDALVADAAGNDLIRVSPEGVAVTVARFDVEAVSTDHLPPEFGELPPTIDAESVPTSIALGDDGWVYVGELKGFPFRPGSSKVWRVDADEEGVLCSVNTPDDDCEVAWEGLTAINDIAYDAEREVLYVYELAEDGTLAFEAGFESGEFPPAVLLEVVDDDRRELARGLLSQPGGVVLGTGRTLYVTDGVFGNGRLVRVRR